MLGGGIVPGAAILLSGEPGVGKSTLLLEVAARAAAPAQRVLYVSAEESVSQVRLRAERTGALQPTSSYLAAETDLATILGQIDAVRPAARHRRLGADRVVAARRMALAGQPGAGARGGSRAHPRRARSATCRPARRARHQRRLDRRARACSSTWSTSCCQFEGDRQTALRFVRALKNRFGPTDEVGCFEMTGDGIAEVPDPSGLFLVARHAPVSGTCVTIALEGRRALPVEVQALDRRQPPAPQPAPGRERRRLLARGDAARGARAARGPPARRARRLRLDRRRRAAHRARRRPRDRARHRDRASSDAPSRTTLAAFGEISLAGEIRPVVSRRAAIIRSPTAGVQPSARCRGRQPSGGARPAAPGRRTQPDPSVGAARRAVERDEWESEFDRAF